MEEGFAILPPEVTLAFRGRRLDFAAGAPPRLMGILNVTPDSFSDGGLHFGDPAAAAEEALRMAAEGADIIDVGGESTRPGATPVPAEEEARRVIPVIEALRRQSAVPLSIDTGKAAVARAALEAGADIVNDVTGLADDGMAAVVAEFQAGCILMHNGAPGGASADEAPRLVADALAKLLARAMAETGLPKTCFAVDPGIGFGKSVPENLALMRERELFFDGGATVLLAFSRKSCLGAVSGERDASRRLPETLAAAVLLRRHCHLLRVHDVAATRRALAVAEALAQ